MPRDATNYNRYQREYQLRRYHARMEEARDYLGGACTKCGETDGLEIDHVDWRSKEIRIAKLWSIARERFFRELDKCQLLCNSCHIDKSRKDISAILRGRNSIG